MYNHAYAIQWYHQIASPLSLFFNVAATVISMVFLKLDGAAFLRQKTSRAVRFQALQHVGLVWGSTSFWQIHVFSPN